MAEQLPYLDSFFDVILILNVLDHCWDPSTALGKIARCLHHNGILILRVNLYNQAISVLHALFQFLDKEHLHAVTHRFLKNHLRAHFDTLKESLLPLGLPDDKQKKALSLGLKAFHLFPSHYTGIFKRK